MRAIDGEEQTLGVERLGDAEIHELRRTVRGDEDVAGLQVAVHDEVLVREVNRRAHLLEQREPLDDGELSAVAVLAYGLPVDVLHDQVRQAVLRRSAVEQARDVRMFDAREDLALVPEATDGGIARQALAQQLDGYQLAILVVAPLSQIDRAHAAARDLPDDLVRPGQGRMVSAGTARQVHRPGRKLALGRRRQPSVVFEKSVEVAPDGARARLVEKEIPFVDIEVARLVEEKPGSLPIPSSVSNGVEIASESTTPLSVTRASRCRGQLQKQRCAPHRCA